MSTCTVLHRLIYINTCIKGSLFFFFFFFFWLLYVRYVVRSVRIWTRKLEGYAKRNGNHSTPLLNVLSFSAWLRDPLLITFHLPQNGKEGAERDRKQIELILHIVLAPDVSSVYVYSWCVALLQIAWHPLSDSFVIYTSYHHHQSLKIISYTRIHPAEDNNPTADTGR